MDEPSTRERRRLRRVVKRIAASYQGESVQGRGYVKNISKYGIFVRAEPLPLPGSRIHVVIESEGSPKFEILGSIRWTTAQLPPQAKAQPGFGVQVEEHSEEFLLFFESLLLH